MEYIMKTIIYTKEEPQGFVVYAECPEIKVGQKIKVDGKYQTVTKIESMKTN